MELPLVVVVFVHQVDDQAEQIVVLAHFAFQDIPAWLQTVLALGSLVACYASLGVAG